VAIIYSKVPLLRPLNTKTINI